MDKKILVLGLVLVLALAIPSVTAWHCVDTDEAKPAWNSSSRTYGSWGDNALLGGTTSGWHEWQTNLPQGCTFTASNQASCEDVCIGATLREFVCDDRESVVGETIIEYREYTDSSECSGEEVPEFGTVATGLAILGAAAGIFLMRRK